MSIDPSNGQDRYLVRLERVRLHLERNRNPPGRIQHSSRRPLEGTYSRPSIPWLVAGVQPAAGALKDGMGQSDNNRRWRLLVSGGSERLAGGACKAERT